MTNKEYNEWLKSLPPNKAAIEKKGQALWKELGMELACFIEGKRERGEDRLTVEGDENDLSILSKRFNFPVEVTKSLMVAFAAVQMHASGHSKQLNAFVGVQVLQQKMQNKEKLTKEDKENLVEHLGDLLSGVIGDKDD